MTCTQYTDVVTAGCFSPIEIGRARRGDASCCSPRSTRDQFKLYRMPLKEPEATSSHVAETSASDSIVVQPFEPPLHADRRRERRRSHYKQKWDLEAPFVSVGVTNDGTFLTNSVIQFSRSAGESARHSIQLLQTVSDLLEHTQAELRST